MQVDSLVQSILDASSVEAGVCRIMRLPPHTSNMIAVDDDIDKPESSRKVSKVPLSTPTMFSSQEETRQRRI